LATAERKGQLRQRLRYLCRACLLVVDEIGYLPVIPGGGTPAAASNVSRREATASYGGLIEMKIGGVEIRRGLQLRPIVDGQLLPVD
jgi:hypothetical protein